MLGHATDLEDELGDVLEKALKYAGLTEESLARLSGVSVAKIKDAEDYRYDLAPDELRRLAETLKLNEIGLSALSRGCYPLPDLGALPCELHVLAMPFGVGRVNAYVLAEPGTESGILFDTGNHIAAMERIWPVSVRRLEGVFLTHWDADHAGGLTGIRERYPQARVYGPGGRRSGCRSLSGGETVEAAGFRIQVLDTPGHAEHHLSYHVRPLSRPDCAGVLVAGDLVFAGSVACAFYSARRLLINVRRVLAELDCETVVAPGHGPLTTVGNERRYNVFHY